MGQVVIGWVLGGKSAGQELMGRVVIGSHWNVRSPSPLSPPRRQDLAPLPRLECSDIITTNCSLNLGWESYAACPDVAQVGLKPFHPSLPEYWDYSPIMQEVEPQPLRTGDLLGGLRICQALNS
ncbi:hypothetical protein AAY473_017191 [Plecturocebus cupreus]